MDSSANNSLEGEGKSGRRERMSEEDRKAVSKRNAIKPASTMAMRTQSLWGNRIQSQTHESEIQTEGEGVQVIIYQLSTVGGRRLPLRFSSLIPPDSNFGSSVGFVGKRKPSGKEIQVLAIGLCAQ